MLTKILVVEDTEDIQFLVESVLLAHDYDVALVSDGAKALTYLKNNALPDLILLDIRMPIMDGWEFRRNQDADPQLRDIPVIVFSNEPDIEMMARMLGASGFALKTDGFDRLLQVIDRFRPSQS
jgi:CheY-like chemotaxis protein